MNECSRRVVALNSNGEEKIALGSLQPRSHPINREVDLRVSVSSIKLASPEEL